MLLVVGARLLLSVFESQMATTISTNIAPITNLRRIFSCSSFPMRNYRLIATGALSAPVRRAKDSGGGAGPHPVDEPDPGTPQSPFFGAAFWHHGRPARERRSG